MRSAAVWLGALVGVAIGCRLPSTYHAHHLTGTCDGACTHYLDCKDSHDPAAHAACAQDCEQVFQDPESIRAFESLECPDTIEYVEGDTGRGPGTIVGSPHAR